MSTFRITTNGLFRNYRSNLTKNNKRLGDAITNVQTQRNFNTYAEDPAAASRAWRLRRAYWRTGDQINNNSYVMSKYESASAAMHAIVDGDSEHPGLDGLLATIEGVSDTAAASRIALGRQLHSTSESVVSMMNSKYGDDYIFAGADGANIPFRWGEGADSDKLYYRGIDVNTPKAKTMEEFGLDEDTLRLVQPLTGELTQAQFDAKKDSAGSDYNKSFDAAFESYDDYKAAYASAKEFEDYKTAYETENPGYRYEDAAELSRMANEATYLDIGLGLKEELDGSFITGSAFNSAVSGLQFLGYGKDGNLAVTLRELGNIFLNCDPETGDYANPTKDKERADELLNILHDNLRDAQQQHVQLETGAKYLQENQKQLDTSLSQLNEQIVQTEQRDPADAITEMTWAQYCYNAALRIGTNLLSQSLIDYLS